MSEASIILGFFFVLVIVIIGLIIFTLVILSKDEKRRKRRIEETEVNINKTAEKRTGNSKTKYCSDCGDEILKTSKFCGGCGKELNKRPKQEDEKRYRIHKKEPKTIKGWVVAVVIIIILLFIFVIPIFPKYENVSSQEIVNRDNCDGADNCVCKQRGGFLWTVCKQCSCTRHRTSTRYVPLIVALS